MREEELRPSSSDHHRSNYKALQATAKALGHTLSLGRRAEDGRIYYFVSHQAQSYHFTHLHDVEGHLNALRGAQNG